MQILCLSTRQREVQASLPHKNRRNRGKFGKCKRQGGRTATQRSKKGSEKVLGRVLGKGFSEGF